jgi:radical SAM protein with 4Fe4S-binding SPASM domain
LVLKLNNFLKNSQSGLYEIVLSITNKCNLKCLFCYANAAKSKNDFIKLAFVKKLFPKLRKLGVQILAITGGEPLLHKDFFKIVKLAKKNFKIIFLATNGYFITERIAKKISKSGISNVQISIEGNKIIHNSIRRNPRSFERARQAVILLKKYLVDVTLTPTLIKRNLKDIQYVYNLSKEIGCDMSIKRQISTGRADWNNEISPEEYRKAYLFGITKNKISKHPKVLMHCDPLRVIFKKGLKKNKLSGCIAGFGLIYVRYDGEIFPCSKLPISVGNLNTATINQILNKNQILQELKNRDNLKGRCGKCHNKLICGGCRAAAYAKYKDLFAEDPVCWIK